METALLLISLSVIVLLFGLSRERARKLESRQTVELLLARLHHCRCSPQLAEEDKSLRSAQLQKEPSQD